MRRDGTTVRTISLRINIVNDFVPKISFTCTMAWMYKDKLISRMEKRKGQGK
jgi:hypothetical protein